MCFSSSPQVGSVAGGHLSHEVSSAVQARRCSLIDALNAKMLDRKTPRIEKSHLKPTTAIFAATVTDDIVSRLAGSSPVAAAVGVQPIVAGVALRPEAAAAAVVLCGAADARDRCNVLVVYCAAKVALGVVSLQTLLECSQQQGVEVASELDCRREVALRSASRGRT